MTKQHNIRLTLENKTLFAFQRNEVTKKSLTTETTSNSSVLTTFSTFIIKVADNK
jgi:hypothetical protein